MKLNTLTPKKVLNKAFLKQRPLRSEIEKFKSNLKTLLLKVEAKEYEENKKNHVRDFLLDTYYKGKNEVNTKDRKDLVIHLDKTNQSKVGVIIEAKTPISVDMVRLDKLNTKAFHELVLYYFDERKTKENSELKNLAINNIYEWFIFDANVFDKQIYRNTKIKNLYQTKINDKKDNPFFYEELRKIIENLDEEITCTYFDLKDYEKVLNNDDLEDDKKLIELYKIFSPYHLLKEPFAEDSNALNKPFYDELLHLIGLEEVKVKSKLIIRRKLEENRDQGSLIENAITILKTKDSLHKVKNIADYGKEKEERYYNVALELCIIWVNRILFLKLLEAQLFNYQKGNKDFRFLNIETIPDFGELFTLFHQVLAKTFDDRNAFIKEKYKNVPYLNSSLFEISELEDQTITFESLKDTATLGFNKKTIFRKFKAENKILTTLEYLFKFLDAYDFASEGFEDVQDDNRSLINASVLGKVFEKINGYKDGSIFTPGFITMYMCRQAIRLAVIQKFKDQYNVDIETLDDLKNFIGGFNKAEKILEYNELINSLHLCDPAVGSGHFLVSSLNEIIAIKCKLGILADKKGVRLSEYEITIENDELILTDENGDIFEYQINENGKPTAKAQRLQKALFHEKQTLIENCLFGVDINPNSVKICRLRLWIELLKNAYYRESSNYTDLETLPNIDINIKEGNSLLSRFSFDEDLKKILETLQYSIEDYRNFVLSYKETRDREKKLEFEAKIKQIKEDFRVELNHFSPERIKLAKLENELFEKESKQFLFGEDEDKKKKRLKRIEKLKFDIDYQNQTLKEIAENVIVKNAFEWRFEFPEILDDEGNFLGFDIIIGNPPYIKEDENRNAFDGLRDKECYQGKMDLWYLFGDLGINLLTENSHLSFIATNNWVTNAGASNFRDIVVRNSQILNLIDFRAYMVFDNASIQTMILLLKRNAKNDNYSFDYRRLKGKKLQLEDTINLLEAKKSEKSVLFSPKIKREHLVGNTFTFNTDKDSIVLNKMKDKQNFFLLGKADKELNLESEIGSGVDVNQDFVSNANVDKLNGNANVGDGVFVLTQDELDNLKLSEKEKEIIKPYYTTEQLQKYFGNPSNQLWLIYTKSNINKLDKNTNQPLIKSYPKVKKHLDKFKDIITSAYKPYGLHRAREQRLFENEKIFSQRKCPKEPTFTYTNFDCFVSRAFMIIQTDRINLKYVTGLLNSKLIAFWLRKKGKMQGNSYQIDKAPLLDIPIIKPSDAKQQSIIKLVDKVLKKKKLGQKTKDVENKIDVMVYRLYDLTDDEIAIVEGN